jgi:hypothetical protein
MLYVRIAFRYTLKISFELDISSVQENLSIGILESIEMGFSQRQLKNMREPDFDIALNMVSGNNGGSNTL